MLMDDLERKRAEEAHTRLAAIVESSDDAIVSKDLNGILQSWNAGAQRIFGYSAEEIVGRSIRVLVPPERMAEETQILAHLRRGERVDHLETERLTKDGRRIDVSLTSSPIFDRTGKVIGASKIARDISDRKRAEETLQAALIAAERAKADAERANGIKDHFLAVLSHELRTPLTSVVMGLAMLRKRPDLNSDMRGLLEMIRFHIELEVGLIDDLLDVTRIARGKIELHRRPVEIRTVVHGAIEVCRSEIEEQRVHINVDLEGAANCWVNADVPRLQQVLWNLLRNAAKFTPEDGCVGVCCRSDRTDVVIEVTDSGIGIEAEALPRVFNAFEQGERSVTRQFGGLGLGLAISKALVEMHGGTIGVYSEGRGRGATFYVRLPLTAPVHQPENPTPAPLRGGIRPLRVLLVEDHLVTAKMVRMVLTAEGHTVEMAGDVATALSLAGTHTFDLLISDIGLPDSSGHDLMRQLRERGYNFPGIALSGYGQDEDLQRSREAGFAVHLIKPASCEAIFGAIASVTGEERTDPALAPKASFETVAPWEVPQPACR